MKLNRQEALIFIAVMVFLLALFLAIEKIA